MKTRTDISNSDDLIDLRDVMARVDELEGQLGPIEDSDGTDQDERLELATLVSLLDECKGNGGDEQWRGDWYPVTLIRDTYFAATDALKQDYTMIDFDGVDYWTR